MPDVAKLHQASEFLIVSAARAGSAGPRTQLAGPGRAGMLAAPPPATQFFRHQEIAAMQVIEAHGARIPAIGLGTMTLKDGICVQAVKTALQLGYTHLDTAWFYGNEKEVGEGLRQSGAKRDSVFVCTKVRETHLMPDKFQQSLDESLKNLQLPFVDLLLIHWNNKDIPFKTSIGALCKAKKDGLARHVGVANFTTSMLDEAWAVTSEPLVCNQIEMHPFINQDKVVAASKKHGMAIVAYCPIARGKVPGAEVLERIGKAHGKSSAQVSLRYLVQMGICAIPRTATPEHLKQNLDIFDFELSEAEMKDLKALNATNMRVVNPPHAPRWDTP
jgi:2,5-diketo-D-gluconate reductase B